jgi:LmbE family N-acetylglucosaminyl deacetylase
VLELLPAVPPADEPLTVLAIGAHSDDIEIGCGATILQLVRDAPSLRVVWVVLSGASDRASEARASAGAFLAGVDHEVQLAEFQDGFFPHDPEVKVFFEGLKRIVAPNVILTHARHDHHQDHRVACELAWNTFRDHLILEYEVPKYDGDLRPPNAFVAVDEELARRKVSLLKTHFATQRDKHWFTDDLFLGLMRLRGAECRSATGFAEAFHAPKITLRLRPS